MQKTSSIVIERPTCLVQERRPTDTTTTYSENKAVYVATRRPMQKRDIRTDGWTDGRTDTPTNGPTLILRWEDASKKSDSQIDRVKDRVREKHGPYAQQRILLMTM